MGVNGGVVRSKIHALVSISAAAEDVQLLGLSVNVRSHDYRELGENCTREKVRSLDLCS